MKILFISRRLPHAGVTGGHVIVHQRVRRLAERGHEIGLACFGDAEDAARADELKPYVRELEIAPPPEPGSWWRRAGATMVSSVPPYFLASRSPDLMRRVGDLVHRGRYDVAIAEFSAMGQYLYGNPHLPAVRKVISCHFGVAASFRRTADLLKHSVRGLGTHWSLWRGLARYEIAMYQNADRVLTLTAKDRYALLSEAPNLRIDVVPAGVDADYFHPDAAVQQEDSVLFTGHYEVEANRDAVRWFATRTWPLVRARHPSMKFHVVGPGGRREFRDLARRDPSVVVVDEVADLRPYLQRARVFVCPVRLGSGQRLKVLEALASGVPVVTTTLGAEGIPLQPGDNVLMADRTALFAAYVNLLLEDEALRGRLSEQGRALVAERFAWTRCVAQLEDILGDVVSSR